MNDSRLMSALLSGVDGTAALPLIHETVRRLRHNAPRMEYARAAIHKAGL